MKKKKLKKIILNAMLYTFCWRNVDRLNDIWVYAKYDLLRRGGKEMEEELKKLGIELARLAKKYETEYFNLSYVHGCVLGNDDPEKEKHISFYIKKEEVEKCLKSYN